MHILCTHEYPSNTVYLAFLYISCVPMFTLVVLYTLYTPIYLVYPCFPLTSNTVYLEYPYISCVSTPISCITTMI